MLRFTVKEMNKTGLLKKHSRQTFKLGLVWGTSGNMSVRIDKNSFLITATGKSLQKIMDRDLVVCKINKDLAPPKASMEWRLHREIYKTRKDVNAVLHSQPLFSTLIACAKDIRLGIIPEALAHIKKIEVVPYYHPGSIKLAKDVGKKAKNAEILLLKNHGVVCLGSSLEEVINRALTLEFLCRLTVLSKTADITLETISNWKAKKFIRLLEREKKV